MGHSLAHIEISAAAAASIRTRLGHRSFASEMVSAAVREWRDTEADRHDSANSGGGFEAPRVMGLDEAKRFIDRNIERAHNESVVIGLADSSDLITKTRNIKVELDSQELNGLRAAQGRATSALWAKLHALPDGDSINQAKVLRLPAPRKAVATATEGKARTVYLVGREQNRTFQILARKESQAEARAEAIRLVNENTEYSALEVRAQTVREDGNPALVTIVRPAPETSVIDVEITTVTVRPGAKAARYLVAFDYHH